ncbi:DUF2268 domain-containing protein [Falsibacillus pallidus]|uniref:Uncharacterized protein YjaZ n=1 Tax=Falsibacillus pallidus TaxID=493781 RepID=A0A370G7P2_9BACI|nr:DUF2268 domain-containing putative Zn-dependent protease [Falsibacillus pallidus]RDI38043.1 uncharacterized protein YjaZ [Falsibacillus pallidus]
MNRYLVILIVLLISLLSGCAEEKISQQASQTKPNTTATPKNEPEMKPIQNAVPVQFKVGEQEFKIVPVFEPILEYIKKVKQSQDPNYKELYISTVVEPFRKEGFGENRGLALKDKYSFAAPINIDRLYESIKLMDENYEHITSLIKEGLEKSAKLLPGSKKTIYLFPINPDQSILISQMKGVAAFSTPEQFIVLQIAPQKYDEIMVPYTIAHEYHHTIYFEKIKNQKKDLIDYDLVEGKADSFANLVIPNMEIPWTMELSDEEEQNIWNWASARRYTYTSNDLAEMRAGNRIIPQWSDYKIGNQIMREFLKENPDLPIREWTYMDADEILKRSGLPQ